MTWPRSQRRELVLDVRPNETPSLPVLEGEVRTHTDREDSCTQCSQYWDRDQYKGLCKCRDGAIDSSRENEGGCYGLGGCVGTPGGRHSMCEVSEALISSMRRESGEAECERKQQKREMTGEVAN